MLVEDQLLGDCSVRLYNRSVNNFHLQSPKNASIRIDHSKDLQPAKKNCKVKLTLGQ